MVAAMKSTNLPTLGVVNVNELYPLPVFQKLTGLSAWAMRQARQSGLKVKTVGRRKFVAGADWAVYLSNLAG